MAATYHRILFRSEEQAELETCPRDGELGAQQVAGRTLCSLVSNGTECSVYRGDFVRLGHWWGQLPFVAGYAAVFVIEAVGAEVEGLAVGQRVLGMGPHQSWQRLAAADVLPVPDELEPETATFARLMAVTMTTLSTTIARPPARVVVTGLGPVGLLGALIFARCGYEVTACDPVDSRRAAAAALGLTDVRAAVPGDDPALRAKVPLVVECSGHEQAVMDSLNLLERRGELVLVGVPARQHTPLHAQELLHRVFLQDLVVRSGTEWEIPRHPQPFRPNSNYGNMAAALRWLAEGSIRLGDLYEVRPPTDPQTIYQDILHQRLTRPAVVLDWRGIE